MNSMLTLLTNEQTHVFSNGTRLQIVLAQPSFVDEM